MVNLWKYPLVYLIVVGAVVGVLCLLDSNRIFTLGINLPDWLRPLIVLPIVIALVSTNLPDFLPKKVLRRLKWLYSRPGINQLYYFVAFQILMIITTSLLVAVLPNNYLVYLFDLMSNILGVVTVGVYIFLMLRITVND